MKNVLFLKFWKIKSSGRVLAAARHNKREIQHERGAEIHIDAARSALNYCVAGNITASGIHEFVKEAITATGVTMRRDGVRAIEAVFSLPKGSSIDHRQYFADCTAWIAKRFGATNVLSSDVHLDEATPHCHVLFLPLVEGRFRGSDLLGGRAQLAKLADEFHANVGTLYGLQRRAPQLSVAQRELLAKTVIDRLRSDHDPALRSSVWFTFREAIEADPDPFAAHLGIDTPEPVNQTKRKSLTETMTGTGKRTNEDRNPIRLAQKPKTSNLLLCKVRARSDDVSPPVSPSESLPIEPPLIETTRVYDTDLSPESFNPETGEFIEKKVRPQLQKLAAARWVSDKLSNGEGRRDNPLKGTTL